MESKNRKVGYIQVICHNMYFLLTTLLIIITLTSGIIVKPSEKPVKPRVIVTCDPELDDCNSLVRFLLYSTDYQVEGLIYASSQYHWKGDGKGTKWFVPGRQYTRKGLNFGPMESWRWDKDEQFILDAVEAYKQVYSNLKLHNPDYPTPEYLKSKILFGNVEFDGDISKDSPGSDYIKSLMLDDVPGPLFITAWGGQSTIARALKSIQDQYENTPDWKEIKEKVSKKVMILPSGDQDDTYKKYIKPNWPNIGYSQLNAGIGLGYGAQRRADPKNVFYYSPAWMKENISSKGPLGAYYRVWGDGKQMVKGDIFDYFGLSGYTDEELKKMGYWVWAPVEEKGSFLGEGDTGTFLNLIDNGLIAWKDESCGGWGGRKRQITIPFDSTVRMNDSTMLAYFRSTNYTSSSNRLLRRDSIIPDFFQAAQNGLAARFQWSVTSNYKDANHEPIIKAPLNITAHPGEKIHLKGKVTDPDGNAVSHNWWQFKVGTCAGEVTIGTPKSISTDVVIPKDALPGQTIHVILEAVDNGSPALTRYHRVIITVL